MTVRAVLYARVCVDDGQNLTEQMETCRKHAQELGLNIVEELAEQGAGSGSPNLSQLDRMLELARAGEFDVLVVRDPYRLSRELAKLLTIEKEVRRQGVQIEYILHSHLGTSVGDMLKSIESFAVRAKRGWSKW